MVALGNLKAGGMYECTRQQKKMQEKSCNLLKEGSKSFHFIFFYGFVEFSKIHESRSLKIIQKM